MAEKDAPATGDADYLFKAGQYREVEAVERVLLDGFLASLAAEYLAPTLGWQGKWAWYAVRIPTDLVFPGRSLAGLPGDVDLMGGRLEFPTDDYAAALAKWQTEKPGWHPSRWDELASLQSLREGRLVWPPRLADIDAAEVKASYLGARGEPKSTKLGRLEKIYRQAAGLGRMGFERVALLWVLATEPVLIEGVSDFWQWIEAGSRGEILADHLQAKLSAQIDEVFGQILLRVAAVPGGTELIRGNMSGRILRDPPNLDRALGSERSAMRAELETFLHGVFSKCAVPRNVPVVIRACAPGGCNEVFVPSVPNDRRCPKCGRFTGGRA